MYRKLTTVAAVAALAFGLAACGGGGGGNGDTSMQMPPDPMPPAPTPVAVTVPDAMYLDAANMPMAGSMTIAAGEMATNNGVIFSCPAGGDACEVEVAADGSVTSTGGEATAALSDAATLQVTQAKKAKEDMLAAEKMERRDRVIGKDRAIEAASGFAADDTAGSLDENDISITRGAGATARVRVTDIAGYTASDMPILQNPGWAETRLMRSVSGATQHLFVYTDIGPPTRIQFYNFDNDPLTPSRYGDNTVVTAVALDLSDIDGAGTTGLTRGSLDSNFNSPGPAAGGNVVQRFPMPSASVQVITRQGNYNGAPGTYSCDSGTAGAACVLTITPTGTYTETTGAWTFTPEVGATAWRNDQEFMSFGWWLQEPNNQDGAYTFQYYADGNAYTAPTAITTGTATYNGRAAGKFVVQEIDDGGVVDGESGMFVAAATLNARFGATANSISGSISGFQSDNANVDVSGWSVTLHRKTLGAMANLPNAFPAITETNSDRATYDGTTATLGDQTAYGDWTGQYFGDANPGNTRNAYPLGVGGTFQADNDAASIAGAFGARR